MCGIICVLSRKGDRATPTHDDIFHQFLEAQTLMEQASTDFTSAERAAEALEAVNTLLKGDAGVRAMVGSPELVDGVRAALAKLAPQVEKYEAALEASQDAHLIENASHTVSAIKDALWSISDDRLRTAREVSLLAGMHASEESLHGYLSIQQALSAIDRMEVRGRDSAGIGVVVWGHGLTEDVVLGDPALRNAFVPRHEDALFTSRSVRVEGDAWVFVYKAAAEIGELGDNTKTMRQHILQDALLRRVVSAKNAQVSVIGHTRWASVGIISEPNAHPVTGEEVNKKQPLVLAVLNGDVDNYADLKVEHDISVAASITTDAKVIPSLVARGLQVGQPLQQSFLNAVTQFDGSVAIAALSVDHPDSVMLALRGSGQGMCIGLAEDRFIVASEPYGTVEDTVNIVRMDGESLVSPDQPASRGQVIQLSASNAGNIAGMERVSYDGSSLPVTSNDVVDAGVTTRDIDRGTSPHFLLKEILEAPESFRKTLRGRIHEINGVCAADLDEDVLPKDVVKLLVARKIRRIRVIGQGTAAVAGSSMVALLNSLSEDAFDVDALTATEFSGFGLLPDMSDTLVIAVSQSGTTTDTNRTVDLARGRGAHVIAIVNRRNSDLAMRADGVLYTSDGRDLEMSVASTKAFYAQVAAGVLLSCAISAAAGVGSNQARHRVLNSLKSIPDAMREVIRERPQIAEAAHRFAPAKRYWAVVGNGPNAVSANEVRIKLSELCYKSISCDITEDKKHIDLSCEPMILVCAAGLVGGTAADVAKEIAIYKAHKATPIVVATRGDQRFDAASAVLMVPEVDPSVAFILSAMVGHLFGYEAALAIDATARPLREIRESIKEIAGTYTESTQVVTHIRRHAVQPAGRFFDALSMGQYDGTLEASTAVRLTSILYDVLSKDPIDAYQRHSGKVVTPAVLLDDLINALTKAIDELTRPIDAIKHQAKTVTVGISRNDEGLMDRALVQAVLAAGVSRDRLAYRTLKILADLDAAVLSVNGFTRYGIDGGEIDEANISIIERGGISLDLKSRVDGVARLVGTKHRVASNQEVLVARGRSDNRTVIFIPELKSGETTGITLLHVTFAQRLSASVMKSVLQGYDDRYNRLVDWVKETESEFRDDLLADIDVVDALILPISDTANRWRAQQS